MKRRFRIVLGVELVKPASDRWKLAKKAVFGMRGGFAPGDLSVIIGPAYDYSQIELRLLHQLGLQQSSGRLRGVGVEMVVFDDAGFFPEEPTGRTPRGSALFSDGFLIDLIDNIPKQKSKKRKKLTRYQILRRPHLKVKPPQRKLPTPVYRPPRGRSIFSNRPIRRVS